MAKAFGQMPSRMLFPNERNPNFMLLVDNLVFEAGYTWELGNRLEEEKTRYDDEVGFLKTLTKFLRR